MAEGTIRHGCSAARDIETAADAVAGIGTTRAVTAKGLVVGELAPQNVEDTTAPDTAARTETGTAASGSRRSPAGFVVDERTTLDREPCQVRQQAPQEYRGERVPQGARPRPRPPRHRGGRLLTSELQRSKCGSALSRRAPYESRPCAPRSNTPRAVWPTPPALPSQAVGRTTIVPPSS